MPIVPIRLFRKHNRVELSLSASKKAPQKAPTSTNKSAHAITWAFDLFILDVLVNFADSLRQEQIANAMYILLKVLFYYFYRLYVMFQPIYEDCLNSQLTKRYAPDLELGVPFDVTPCNLVSAVF